MGKPADLTSDAQSGFDAEAGAKCPCFESSPSGMAWLVGQWMKAQGMARPYDAAMSRGYVVRVNGSRFNVGNPSAIRMLAD